MALPSSMTLCLPKSRVQVCGILGRPPCHNTQVASKQGNARTTQLRAFPVSTSLSSGGSGHQVGRLHVVAAESPTAAKEGWWMRDSADNMVDVGGLRELTTELEGAKDRLVIVDFYAQWCNSCRALYPKLCKLARNYPSILILKVNWADNKALCKSMGIKALPYFHFYRGAEGRVEAFSASITKFKRIRDAVDLHSTPRCSLGPSVSCKDLFVSSEGRPTSPVHIGNERTSNQHAAPPPPSPRKALAGAIA